MQWRITREVHVMCDDTELTMTRDQLLAAEVFSYSYANYLDHLGIGNNLDRFCFLAAAIATRASLFL